jgi:RNA polymerase sigma factor (sigma-70 family)
MCTSRSSPSAADCTGANPVDDSPGAATDERNDSELLRALVVKHSDRLQRFIMKHIGNATEAEELAQQAFVEAAASYKAFRGESQLSSWLYGIALNLVRNYLSRAPERRHEFVSESALDVQSSPDLSPEQTLEQNQTIALLEESIRELPENMREILLLVGFDELSYEEAATLLTVPIGTIRSRLSRARIALREKMRQKGLSFEK